MRTWRFSWWIPTKKWKLTIEYSRASCPCIPTPWVPPGLSRAVFFSTLSWCVSGRTTFGQPLLTVINEGTLAMDHAVRTHGLRSEPTCPGRKFHEPASDFICRGSGRNEEFDVVLQTQGDRLGAVSQLQLTELPL